MKKPVLLSILLYHAFIVATYAQAPNWQWAEGCKNGGKPSFALSTGSVTDKNGNTYLIGTFYDTTITFGNITLTDNGNPFYYSSPFIVKFDSSGNVLWAQTTGGPGGVQVSAITLDSSGNIFLSGLFFGPVLFGNIALPGDSSAYALIFTVKYDPEGNALWARQGTMFSYVNGPLPNPYVQTLCTDGGGNIYVGGTFGTSVIFGNDTLYMNPSDLYDFTNPNIYDPEDYFVVKYDPTGNMLWARNMGHLAMLAMSGDNQDNLLVAANAVDNITIGNLAVSYSNDSLCIFMARYDAMGNLVSVAQSPSWYSAYHFVYTMQMDAYGNAYVGGYFDMDTIVLNGEAFSNEGPGAGYNTIRFNASGNVTLTLLTSSAAIVSNLWIDEGGNIYLFGSIYADTVSFGNTILYNTPYNFNDFIVKYDATGNVKWALDIPSNGAGATGFSVIGENDIYVSGNFDGTYIQFGDNKLSVNNPYDNNNHVISFNPEYYYTNPFVAKLENTMATEPPDTAHAIIVYPNPTTGFLFFGGTENGEQLQIFDAEGRLVHSSNITSGNYLVNLSILASGIYFYRITNGASYVQKGKFIVTQP